MENTTEPVQTDAQAPTSPQPNPPGAYYTFLAVAGLGYLALLVLVFAFGLYGDALTTGVDEACAEAAFQNGKQLEAQGNFDLAIQRYHQALEGRFADKAREYECARSIGEGLVHLSRYEEAVDAYQALAPEAFSKPGHLTGYVTALFSVGHYDDAERLGKDWLAKAEAAHDTKQLTWANAILGHTCERLNRLDDALAYFRAAAALDPQTDSGIGIARVLDKQGKSDEAVRQLDAFLDLVKSGQLHEDAQRLRNGTAGQAPQS